MIAAGRRLSVNLDTHFQLTISEPAMPAASQESRPDSQTLAAHGEVRHDWSLEEIEALFALPFNDLLFRAQQVHRAYFEANAVQVSTLLSIKTGACPEDCKYCPQSGHYNTGLGKEKLLEIEKVVEQARAAQEAGASRFCMGAAWKSPRERDLEVVLEMVRRVKALGLETCMTLGMVDGDQASRLAEAGLDYYNHNLDTSPEYYGEIITTRTYADRLETLGNVRGAGMKVCSGASSAWARRPATAPPCSSSWSGSSRTRSRCRSTCWSRCPARRWRTSRIWTPSSTCAPSPWPAS